MMKHLVLAVLMAVGCASDHTPAPGDPCADGRGVLVEDNGLQCEIACYSAADASTEPCSPEQVAHYETDGVCWCGAKP